MNAIIIEDDINIRKGLTLLITQFATDISIKGVSGSVSEGYEIIVNHLPEVLFLDIQIIDGSSFDILEKLHATHPDYMPKVVFITAFQEYAIKAFKYSALDYLLKPIDPIELNLVLDKLRKQNQNSSYQQIQVLLENFNKPKEDKKIALATQSQTYIVKIKDIIRCESSGGYTMFSVLNQPNITVSKTIKEYEELLCKEGFERIHQSHLINTNFIKAFLKKESIFLMEDNTEVPISSRKKDNINDIITKITQ